jgi:hypothetical protein
MSLLGLASWFSCSCQRLLLSLAILALLCAAAPAQGPADKAEIQAAGEQPYPDDGHCQSKFVYFAKTSEPDFVAIDFPAFFRVDLSGSMAAPSI